VLYGCRPFARLGHGADIWFDLASVSLGDPPKWRPASVPNTLSGTVDNISALVDPDTRSVQVRVVVENPGNF
jgi:cobalt-zinc-cadmium efflux system membrane fusion protein